MEKSPESSETESDEVWAQLTAPASVSFTDRASSLKQLVHYTNFATLKGIIQNRELWFSPVAGMNDWDEVQRGKRLLEKLSQQGAPLRVCFDRIRSVDNELWQRLDELYRTRLHQDLRDTFISCWSECDLLAKSHDNLAMWRGYASDGNGVAIVIDPIALQIGSPYMSDIVACPVFYETESQFEARACRAFTAYADALLAMDSEKRVRNGFQVEMAFAEICFHLAVTHKHPAFALEREWRFVWRRHLDDGSLSKRVRPELTKRGLFEFFCLSIDDLGKVAPVSPKIFEIIKSVMIGPTDDVFLKMQAVRRLLAMHEFTGVANIVDVSDIPYRSFS